MENIDFISIYRKYRSRAVNVANTVLKDKDEAEDVCQETFEILYKLGEKVDFYDEEKLANFISRISYHKAQDHCKRAFRQHEVGSDDIIMTADQTVNSGDEVDEMIAALEATGYLQTIFQKLREKNRMDYEIYVGVTVYGIPSRLVAEHYHITENNVNNKVMRTRRWLAREYDALCDAQDLIDPDTRWFRKSTCRYTGSVHIYIICLRSLQSDL